MGKLPSLVESPQRLFNVTLKFSLQLFQPNPKEKNSVNMKTVSWKQVLPNHVTSQNSNQFFF